MWRAARAPGAAPDGRAPGPRRPGVRRARSGDGGRRRAVAAARCPGSVRGPGSRCRSRGVPWPWSRSWSAPGCCSPRSPPRTPPPPRPRRCRDPRPSPCPPRSWRSSSRAPDGLTVYQTAVSEVCPPAATDCAVSDHVTRRIVGIPSDLVPRGLAMDRQKPAQGAARGGRPGCRQRVGRDARRHRRSPRSTGCRPRPRRPLARPRRAARHTPGARIAGTGRPGHPAASSDPTAPARVLAILEGVEAVGAPPAWSPTAPCSPSARCPWTDRWTGHLPLAAGR